MLQRGHWVLGSSSVSVSAFVDGEIAKLSDLTVGSSALDVGNRLVRAA
jgi:hypothetical protein